MALDIIISDSHDNPIKSLPFFIEEYDIIQEAIGNEKDFSLLKSAIPDYYGQSEIYLDQLHKLKSELLLLKDVVLVSDKPDVKNFITDFLQLVEYAIIHRKTIKFEGD